MKNSKAWIFLTYLDSLVKLPAAEFNEAAMMSVHKKYAIELPLVIYDPAKEQNRQDIIIQYYKNNNTSNEVETGIILLIPETITDSLVVGDFTRYFGPITDEQPLIGITEQPRPVRIRVSPDRTIKLTFENNRNRDQAGVTRVEILNYR
ncbi:MULTISPECIES: hypothetical protein [unclassified Chryseobacterium]|nr:MULTISPECIES: hypothetical protein [unclassified Chryseobacterium]